jgi:hypothetical protein
MAADSAIKLNESRFERSTIARNKVLTEWPACAIFAVMKPARESFRRLAELNVSDTKGIGVGAPGRVELPTNGLGISGPVFVLFVVNGLGWACLW